MNFLYIWAILALIGWYTLITESGRLFLRKYSPWNEDQIRIGIWMAAVLSFVIVNPVSHAVIAGVGLITYWVLSKGSPWTNPQKKSLISFGENKIEPFVYEINCIPKEENDEMTTSRNNLQRKLYSSPYIDPKSHPKIFFNGQEFKVQVGLISDQYISSLIKNLSQAGFNINLINK